MALRRLALPRRGRGGAAAAGRCAGSTVSATPTRVTDLPAGANHHWTKNIIATADGTKLYATVGSNSNIGDNGLAAEQGRAAIWEIDRASGRKRLHATGLRNPNGMAWEPQTKALWTVVNERDELGDDLVPDYLTSVKDGALYGWPWSYWVGRVDKRVQPTNPGMVARAIAPDYGLGSHVAPLGLAFSDERMPANDRSGAFIGQHGARNRDQLSGYNVVFVPLPRVSRRACRWRCSADSWTTRAGPTAGRSASRSRARALCSSPTMSATRCGG